MANVIEFVIKASAVQGTSAMDKMHRAITKIVKVAAVVGTVLAASFGKILKTIVNVGSKVENLRIRLNALLGSAKEGGRAFDEMAKFAATVPFSFDAIMESATTLAGVVGDGVDEMKQWMPIIADLATVSGLSIQDATSQIQRMLSAGAGAADLFRERGVTAMLGFQAGVAVSVEDTKRRLIEAFEDPASKFRGASLKMATTWDGVLSMIGDKWFTFKSNIADAGIFNFIKAIAIAFDQWLGGALKSSGDTAKSFSDFLIGSLRAIGTAVGFVTDMFLGWQVVWKGLQVVFATVITSLLGQLTSLAEGFRSIANLIPGIDIGPMETMNAILETAQGRTAELTNELSELVQTKMPSEGIKNFMGEVEQTFIRLQELGESTAEAVKAPLETLTEFQAEMKENYAMFLTEMGELNATFAESFFDLMSKTIDSISDAVGTAIVTGASLADAFKAIGKQVLAQIISMFVKMGIQRLILSALTKGAVATEAATEASKAVGLASANGVASMAAAPFPINTTAPAFGTAMGAAAATQFTAGAATGKALGATIGIAHGGLTNVPSESTFLLNKGERVLSPNQNKDFTDFINGGAGAGGAVIIENIEIRILENATNAEALLNLDKVTLEELVAGPILETLNSLDKKGVRQNAFERGTL